MTAGRRLALIALTVVLNACGGHGGGGGATPSSGQSTGQTGGGGPTAGQEFYAAPVRVSDTLKFTAVAAGYSHTCAIATDGDTYCWGDNEWDQLGSTASMQTCSGGTRPCSYVPVRVDGGHRFRELAASMRFTCGLDEAGAAWCWGFGLGGQLGDGLRTNSVLPVAVAGGLVFATLSASVSGNVTCGLTPGGEGWCWGVTTDGEFGNGTQQSVQAVPGPVASGSTFVSISVGDGHVCGVDTAHDAQCWGSNWYGELGVGSAGGDGGLADSYSPVAVQGGLKFGQVVAAAYHTCGLTAAGAAYCWGLPTELGSTPAGSGYQALPLEVTWSGAPWASLGRGYGQTCGLTAAGELDCWGQIVAASGDTAVLPVAIGNGQSFSAFSAGNGYACGVGADEFMYCWGENYWGQVGRPPSDP